MGCILFIACCAVVKQEHTNMYLYIYIYSVGFDSLHSWKVYYAILDSGLLCYMISNSALLYCNSLHVLLFQMCCGTQGCQTHI